MWCYDEGFSLLLDLCVDHGQDRDGVIRLRNGTCLWIRVEEELVRKCEVDIIFIHRLVNITIPVPLLYVVTQFINGICFRNKFVYF